MKRQNSDFDCDDPIMLQYLLGVLPQQWQARFEEMLFTEQECLERLRVVEDKLVDDYVSKTLTAADHQRFEEFYLTSERRRQKVELALALKKSLADLSAQAEASPQTPPDPTSSWQMVRQWFTFFTLQIRTRFRIALLMAVLLLIGGGICLLAVLLRLPRTTNEGPIARAEPSAPNVSPLTTPDTASSSPSITTKPSPPIQPQMHDNRLTLELHPDASRDGSDALKSLSLPDRKPPFLRLKLSLPQQPRYSVWRVIVTTAEGTEVVRASGALGKDQARQSYIVTDLPIRKLPIGDYIVTLQGKAAFGSFTEVEDYAFRLTDR